MKRQEKERSLQEIYREIEENHHLASYSRCPWQRAYFFQQLMADIRQFIQVARQVADRVPERQFTLAELAQYDGANGAPAYVAVNGIVYDVSTEPTWGGGTHFSLYAGKDLTAQFAGCHQGQMAILQSLPKVGVLVESTGS